MQKSVTFLYTNNDHAEKEIRKTILFTIALKIPSNKPNQKHERALE
jgi:hypothetical protein